MPNQFSNPITQEELDFLKENRMDHTIKELTQLLNNKFNKGRNPNMIKKVCREVLGFNGVCGVKFTNRWTEEQEQWLIDNIKGKTRKELTELYNKRFNIHRSESVIKHKCNADLHLKFDGIGHKIESIKRTKPEGYIAKAGAGYKKIKHNGKYISLGKYVWEKYYKEEVKENEFIIFLDGNIENFDINNLAKVPRGVQIALNQRHWQYQGEITKAAIEVIKAEKELKKFN